MNLINTNLIIVTVGFIQCLGLFYIVGKKSKNSNLAKIYLMAYLVVIMLQLLLKGVSKIWVMDNYLFVYRIAYELPFLYGPLVFLYTRHSIKPTVQVNKKDILHFIPFTVAVALNIALSMFAAHEIFTFVFPDYTIRGILYTALKITSLAVYTFLSFKYLKQHESAVSLHSGDYNGVKMPWLRQLNLVNFFVGIIICIGLELMYAYMIMGEVRLLFFSLTILIYWISYKAVENPVLLDLKEQMPVTKNVENRSKYQRSTLQDNDLDLIIQMLHNYFITKKPFLDTGLTMNRIAEETGISKHNISQALNMRMQKTYFDFVNAYRIDHAKKLLWDEQYDKYTIAAISKQCGFNSVAGFTSVFKKMTGKTPAQFKKERSTVTKNTSLSLS